MGRVRVYDAEDLAINMAERFHDRRWERRETLRHNWPAMMQNVGDSLAVAYASDKWKPKNAQGRRDMELYKHLAESRNRALVKPGWLFDFYQHNSSWPVRGPTVSMASVPMPKHYARLGLFEEIDLLLYTSGTSRNPRFSTKKNEGVVKVTCKHGYLGGSYIRWSEIDDGVDDQPFIFVYTKTDGPCIVVVGDSLDVKKDGIVG